MRKCDFAAAFAGLLVASWLGLAMAQAPTPRPSGSQPPPASDEDRSRCYCFYIGQKSFQKTRTCSDMDPDDAVDCDAAGKRMKAEWGDGCKGARDGGAKACPYKR